MRKPIVTQPVTQPVKHLLIAVVVSSVLWPLATPARAQNDKNDKNGKESLAPRTFKPARIAVVDIAEVFENYTKKKDVEARLEKQVKAEEAKMQEKEKEYKGLLEELKNVEDGTEQHKTLTLKKIELEYQVKNRQKELLKEFQDKQVSALREIRDEITAEITQYATAMDIDLVLEKKISAEGKGQSINWPVVHFVKPELDITQDIVKRVNAKYTPRREDAKDAKDTKEAKDAKNSKENKASKG